MDVVKEIHMGCGSCGGGPKPSFREHILTQKVGSNLVSAFKQQEHKLAWFLDGASKIKKCLTGTQKYTDEGIIANREVCRNCEWATKNADGELNIKSQCMAPDPAKNNAACGCFILCKTQTDVCPLGKFTSLTINKT